MVQGLGFWILGLWLGTGGFGVCYPSSFRTSVLSPQSIKNDAVSLCPLAAAL